MKKLIWLTLCIFLVTLMVSTNTVRASDPPLTAELDYFNLPHGQYPIAENGEYLMSLQYIFQALGANVTWDNSKQIATVIKGSTSVKLTIGSTQAYIDETPFTLSQPPKLTNGIPMVTLSFVSKAMGARVEWVAHRNKVIIFSQENWTNNMAAGDKFVQALNHTDKSQRIVLYSQAIELDPQFYMAYVNRGEAYYSDGLYDTARLDIDQAIAIKPNQPAAYYVRGLLLAGQSKYEEAVTDYNQAIELGPNLAMPYAKRAQAFNDLEKYDQAMADINKALAIDPGDENFYNTRGLTYYDMKKINLAIADFNRAIEIDPVDEAFYVNRGDSYHLQYRNDLAIDDYGRALEINPQYDRAYNQRGNLYRDQGDYDLAIIDYTRAIEINPQALYFTNRGLAYQYLRQPEKALADYSKAVEKDPLYTRGYYLQGDIYYDLASYDQAVVSYTRAIELDNDNDVYYADRGEAYYKLSKHDLAIADYSKAIEINPKNAQYFGNRARSYLVLGQYDQAISDYNLALALKPWNNYDLYFGRGKACQAMKQYFKAADDFTMAINGGGGYVYTIDPKTGKFTVIAKIKEAYYERALCYEQLGQIQMAIADLEDALREDENYTEAKTALERLKKK